MCSKRHVPSRASDQRRHLGFVIVFAGCSVGSQGNICLFEASSIVP